MPTTEFDHALAELGHAQTQGIQGQLYKHDIKTRLFGARESPQRIGRFIVLGPLGKGGMGTVLRAYDDTLDRQVAVKLMRQDMQERHAARILREAQALARLSHPNVVQVYEVGDVDGQTFIAMELLHGETLRQWQQTPHRWRVRLDAYLQAGRGLAAAHAEGLVHRDFKPANCIRDAQGRVRVLDFGLARGKGERDETRDSSASDTRPAVSQGMLSKRLTQTGSVLGTRAFMAPEQLAQQPADAHSDQFSFCVALYEALLGQRPYRDVPLPVLVMSTMGTEPPPAITVPAGSGVPRRIQRALRRGLSPHPHLRWPSMEALLHELERGGRARWVRSAPWVGATLGVLTSTALALRPTAEPSPPPCQDAQARLGDVWDDERQQQARDAVLSTGLAYAPETWATVQHKLDAYAEDWVREATAACEATRIHHEQSPQELRLRERCLRRSRTALSHDVELLVDADAQVVDTAVELVAQLPRLERCADVEALTRAAGPERSLETEREVERLRDQVARARSLNTTGKQEQGLTVIAPIVMHAESLGAHRLWAEALQVQGELHLRNGNDLQGLDLLQLAHTKALEHGADEVAIKAMSGLIYLQGVEQAQTEVGVSLGTTAVALAARYDRQGSLHAEVLTSVAHVLTLRGELPEARQHYQQALEILQRLRGANDIALVEPLDGLAQMSRKQGELEQAEALYRRALSIRTAKLGARHSETAHLMVNLGAVLTDRGAHRDAEQQYRVALGILGEALGPDNPRIAHARSNLGTLMSKQGRHASAEVQLRAAAEIWQLAHGPDHPRVALARQNLAVVLEAQGRHEDAIEQYRRTLGIWRKGSTREHQQRTAHALRNLGNLLATVGRGDEARAHYQEALEQASRSLGPDAPLVASILNRLGALLLSRDGDGVEVESLHRRALEIYEQRFGAEHPRIGHTLRFVAKAQVARRQWAAAAQSLERALAIYAKSGDAAKPEHVADAELTLAEVVWQLGDRQAAVQIAVRATERLSGEDPAAVRGQAWLEAHRLRRRLRPL